MQHEIEYSAIESFWLWAVAVVGFVVINTAFIYGLFFQPGAMRAALSNPLSAAFIVEALLLVIVLAYLLIKWKVSRLSWGWFIVLALIGSIAFALPLVLLWPKSKSGSGS